MNAGEGQTSTEQPLATRPATLEPKEIEIAAPVVPPDEDDAQRVADGPPAHKAIGINGQTHP